MARGRMLNKSVSLSLKFDQLPDDTCRLLATWTIPQLDFNGIFYADPAIVKSMIFPRRVDVTVEQIATCLDTMVQVGLIIIFEAKGQYWQWWPGFAENQVGLRADRESTDFPPPPDEIQQDDGNVPETIQQDDGKKPAEHESQVESESESTDSTPTEADAPAKAPSPRKEKPKTPKQEISQAMFSALATLCKIDWRICTDEQRGALNSSEKKLREIGATPDDLGEFHRWWYTHDWRGKKNREPPEPHQVREKWGEFVAWREEITPPDPVPDNGNGADPLLSWWQLQLALLNPAWKSATPVSRENGKLVVRIGQPGPRAHLSLPARLQAAAKAIDGVEEVEVIA